MKKWIAAMLVAVVFSSSAWAQGASALGKDSIINKDIPVAGHWDEGGMEFSFMTGPFFGPSFGVEGGRDHIAYFANNPRIAYNLTDIWGSDSAWYRGNVQVVGELFLAEMFATNGGGRIVVGPNALFRYNFVQTGWKIVPYYQLGPGLVYTDTNNNAIGSHCGFQLNMGVGLRYLFNEKWSLNTEFDWHHMSNAGLAEKNPGSNEAGGLLGISYFFR